MSTTSQLGNILDSALKDGIVSQSRNELLHELSSLHALKSVIESRINALAPVSRLLPEILAHIFSFLEEQLPIPTSSSRYEWDDRIQRTIEQNLGWIKVTHVCRYWRQVALAHPRLWRNVSFGISEQWTKELLNRSGACPITVDLSNTVPQYAWVPLLAEHLSHTQVLRLDKHFPLTELALLSLPAPVLEEFLWLYSSGLFYSPSMFHISKPTTVTLPSPLFSDCAPRLRSIILRGWDNIPWASEQFARLTRLEIHGSEDNPDGSRRLDGPLPREDIATALRSLRNVETLILHWSLPSDQRAFGGLRPIKLPRLTHLSVVDKCPSVILLLQNLVIRAVASTDITISAYSEMDDDDCRSMASLLFAPLRHPLTLRTVEYSTGTEDSILKAWAFSVVGADSADFLANGPHPPYLSLRCPLRANLLFVALPLDGVRVFSIGHTEETWTAQDWRTRLGRCRELEHVLVVSPRSAATLVRALSARLARRAPRPDRGVMFPKLRSIEYASRNRDPAVISVDKMHMAREERGLNRVEVVDLSGPKPWSWIERHKPTREERRSTS
ncbi:hypothetical protein BV25DRAFT_226688 [Artomyces pyxidatus]|uniref:Uncharacterized protein n=1 Tax=Artomyces pyxidatus TaxID=48021 RepID=A0ACB8SHG8_9AGAM|nr:hypothetical protein BV25DRAFT_226688 [Artomyces pyxidatus]